ncbi:MAG: DUF389 domain-containing protein [Patescibacteria group bacterium]|nr:DUF389 domain-containing protein [Patescibacteria group bacterium]
MFWDNFEIVRKIKIENSYQELFEKSKLDFDFAFLSLAGLSICILGLSINSSAMIIAPLIYSILVLPAAVVWKDKEGFFSSLWSLFLELIIGFVFCVALSYVLGVDTQGIDFITNLGQNPLSYFLVATIAGSAAALSLFWPGVSEKLTGVAVSVALVPPMAIMGIAVADQSREVLLNATVNLSLNLVGIIFGAYVILQFIKSRV